jgi:hypothetical protein
MFCITLVAFEQTTKNNYYAEQHEQSAESREGS